MLKTKRRHLKPQTLFLLNRLNERPYNTHELHTKLLIYSPSSRIKELEHIGCAIERQWVKIEHAKGDIRRIRQYALLSQFDKEENNDE